jgi:hypothetical protein
MNQNSTVDKFALDQDTLIEIPISLQGEIMPATVPRLLRERGSLAPFAAPEGEFAEQHTIDVRSHSTQRPGGRSSSAISGRSSSGPVSRTTTCSRSA